MCWGLRAAHLSGCTSVRSQGEGKDPERGTGPRVRRPSRFSELQLGQPRGRWHAGLLCAGGSRHGPHHVGLTQGSLPVDFKIFILENVLSISILPSEWWFWGVSLLSSLKLICHEMILVSV